MPAPATPPLGTGSANVYVPVNSGGSTGDGAEAIATTSLDVQPLSALTSLSYSTCVTANNGQRFPYLQLISG
ncbi:MAG TPA: hypothetical protein VEF06_02340 [Bryobacteraceae bacterium]|nr:hypothetical protein [Bryobacteraceae bacterium]